MKKNRLLIEVTTTGIYQHLTDQPTADLAYDEFINSSERKIKLISYKAKNYEIQDFIINKPKEKKKCTR